MSFRPPSAALAVALAFAAAATAAASPPASSAPGVVVADSTRRSAAGEDVPLSELVRIDRRAFGRSGTLRIAVVHPLEAVTVPFVQPFGEADGVTYRWLPVHGTEPERLGGELRLSGPLQAPSQPGMWRLLLRRGDETHAVEELMVITTVPFSEKRNGRLNGYHIGTYPTERSGRTDAYAPPAGFIEVTPANRDLYISKHFRLGQFLTKDQFDVWPKYVALDLRLIDKLELVMQELNAMGVRAERMHVMSGFRTPQYNGPGEGGRALLSRHTYGDAADVWVENGSGHGYIADLNGDGRRDVNDAVLILEAVERVEQKHPDLVGGAGVYRENGARGPFVHIDVRGHRSRW